MPLATQPGSKSTGTDVIVVGAGPSGLATAIQLARSGMSVCVFERQPGIPDRPCGDAHTGASRRALSALGVLDGLMAAGSMSPGYSVCLDGAHPVEFHPGLEGNCLLVPRPILSRALVDAAVSAGVEIHSGRGVTGLVRGPGGEVSGVRVRIGGGELVRSARLTVLAVGAGLCTSAWLGAATVRLGWAARCILDGPHDVRLLEFHLHPDFLPGYLWVFPLAPGRVNIGVGFPNGTGGPRLLRRAMDDWLAPYVRRRFPGVRAALRSGAIGIEPPPCQWPPGILLVGDAAGVADPFTGEGISMALETGMLVAQRVAQHGLSKGALTAMSESIPSLMRERYRQRRRVAASFSRLASIPGLVRFSLCAARLSPAGLHVINRLMTQR